MIATRKPSRRSYKCSRFIVNPQDADLAQKVCEFIRKFFNVAHSGLMAHTRRPEVAWPRMIAVFFVCAFTPLPSREVGKIFNKDRSWVSTACKAVKTRAEAEVPFAKAIAEINKELKKEVLHGHNARI